MQQTEDGRLRALLDAGIAVSSELSIDAVLQRIVEAAAELTGAAYAALGVIQRGSGLEKFVVTGLDEETVEAIGPPPRGRGILGVLIRDATPLRLRDASRRAGTEIAGVSQPGIVAELSDRLAMLTCDPSTVEKAAIVVPLRPGSRTEVEGLLRNGPPFEPERLGLVRHEVYVSDDEVIFVFQGLPAVFAERLAEDDSFWNAATAWRPLVRGRARLADSAYGWT